MTTSCLGDTASVRAQDEPSQVQAGDTQATAGQTPSRSVVLGEWRATPTHVGTGPFAAAEEHAYWTPAGRQFAVIRNKFEALENEGTPCSISRVRLIVNTGADYGLADPDPPEGGGRWPDEVRRSTWVFALKAGEKPVALAIIRPPHDTDTCPNGFYSPWPKLGTAKIIIPLTSLPSLDDLAEVEQHSKPARLGQLEVTLTTVGLASGYWDPMGFQRPQHGRHEAVASLAIRNVSRFPNCTKLYNTHLFDNRGFEYSASEFRADPFRGWGLQTGETTGANVRFEIWDGTAPRLLTLRRDVAWERDCADEQHRPVDMDGGSEVHFAITGVPVLNLPAGR